MVKLGFFYGIAAIILLPLMLLTWQSLSQSSEIFGFLVKTVLTDVVINSLVITGFTAIGVLVIGVSCAWLTTRYNFYGVRFLRWMLLFPLAFPSYILAYSYTDFFDVGGRLWQITGVDFLSIRSIGGACFILSLCLYPYIYMFARTGFLIGSQSQLDAGKILGANKWQQFFEIALPAARPFIIVGLMLVIMESLSDYGTMAYFGIRVFSTGIYDAWAGYGDAIAAARLSLILLSFIIVLILIEKKQRQKMRFHTLETAENKATSLLKVSGIKSLAMMLWCLLPVFFGFIFPVILLVSLAFEAMEYSPTLPVIMAVIPYAINSFILALIVSLVALIIAFTLVSFVRSHGTKTTRILYSICSFGYALPGVILGLGMLFVSSVFGDINFIVSSAFVFLVIAYLIRFLTISLQSFEAGFSKISPSIYQASKMMRSNIFYDFWQIKLPLLSSAILSAGLLLFVEVIKELPITLMLRPFDFDTLAVRAYHLASDERLGDAALPSLFIVIVGCIPVIILSRLQKYR